MKNRLKHLSASLLFIVVLFGWNGCKDNSNQDKNFDRIMPYSNNPAYWQYKKKPVLLLGGSSNHNIFQHDSISLQRELNKLVFNGGNYIRNTLSFRAGEEVFAFKKDTISNLFDLTNWNEKYWQKLDYFLKLTHEKEIIVQLEIWETYDFYSRSSHKLNGKTAWERNPFNPSNNINYEEDESGLSENFQSNGQSLINPFFSTVMPLPEPFDFNFAPLLLNYQQKFVDKILSLSLNYDHILYCIDNETQADPKWSIYWAQYILAKASVKNLKVEITEMWDPFDPSGGEIQGALMQSPANHFFTLRSNVSVTLNNPEIFTFVDISNHNAQVGETHFKTAFHVWSKIQKSGIIRPLNNTKIYGAGEKDWNGTDKDGLERFWRNIFAGSASARFHRPPSGLGNSDVAMFHIKSMRMLTNSIDIFSCKPENEFLSGRDENEAFCLANKKGEYLLFFPEKGEVTMNVKKGSYTIQWLNIESSIWSEINTIDLPDTINTPGDAFWAARIIKK